MWDFVKEHGELLRDLAALGFVIYIAVMVARHGFPWVWAKAVSIEQSVAGATSGLVSRVEALEANVAALHAGTGVVPVAPIPAKAKALLPSGWHQTVNLGPSGQTGISGPTGA